MSEWRMKVTAKCVARGIVWNRYVQRVVAKGYNRYQGLFHGSYVQESQ